MVHLLPVRLLLTLIVTLVGIAVLAAFYAGWLGKGDELHDAFQIIRWSSFGAIAIAVSSVALWRWVPLVQHCTFPYLGGKWSGQLKYHGQYGSGTRTIDLEIRHTPLKIELILSSKESTSRTLVVYPERDKGVNTNRLYYVYSNERKEGVSGAGERYRGLAIMRIDFANHPTLRGNYFAESDRSGTLHLKRDEQNPCWLLWR